MPLFSHNCRLNLALIRDRVELKFSDDQWSEEFDGADPWVEEVRPTLAPGFGNTQRMGHNIRIRSIFFMYEISHNWDILVGRVPLPGLPTTPPYLHIAPGSIRVLVVWDKQPGITVPSVVPDVIDHALGHVNLDNRERFFIISDRIHPIGRYFMMRDPTVDPATDPTAQQSWPTAVNWDSKCVIVKKIFKKVDLVMSFNDVALAPNPVRGKLYMMFTSTREGRLPNAGSAYTVTASMRLRWHDMSLETPIGS